jgi:protocatechuate 3,4-dioxygenase alpha subunit
MTWLCDENIAAPTVKGERVSVTGRVLDGDGAAVGDAMLEIWQANSHGRYAHPDDMRDLPLDEGFSGFGRVCTDAEGRFRFHTIKPGRVPGADGALQAPHLNVTVFARGMLKHLTTRMYFAGDPANAHDPVLAAVPPERRDTLVARSGAAALEWNVVLQGRGETVFFEV